MTVAALALTLCAFVVLRTAVSAHSVFADNAAKDRLIVNHRSSSTLLLPRRFAGVVADSAGVEAVHYGIRLSARSPKNPRVAITTIAADVPTFTTVYDEVVLDDAARERWQSNRSGAIVGSALAERLGVRQGDKIVLQQRNGPELQVDIEGVYERTRPGFWLTLLVIHYDLWNEGAAEDRQNKVDTIIVRSAAGSDVAAVAGDIETALRGIGEPTAVRSEQAQREAALGGFAAILAAIDVGSIAVSLIMLLLLANTMAMGTRERRSEYAVCRALGFKGGRIWAMVLYEALTVGVCGALAGSLLSYPLVNIWLADWLAARAGPLIPYWRAEPEAFLVGAALVIAVSAVGALIPAHRAASVPVTSALRQVD